MQFGQGRLRDCSDGEMICQTSALNYAGFFALYFPIARFPFSHRDLIETNLRNLNIPSRVLLCRRLALCARCRAVRSALVFTLAGSPAAPTAAGRQAIHHPPSPRRAPSAPANRAAGGAAPAGRPAVSLGSPRRASRAGGALASPRALQGQNRTGTVG